MSEARSKHTEKQHSFFMFFLCYISLTSSAKWSGDKTLAFFVFDVIVSDQVGSVSFPMQLNLHISYFNVWFLAISLITWALVTHLPCYRKVLNSSFPFDLCSQFFSIPSRKTQIREVFLPICQEVDHRMCSISVVLIIFICL